MADPLSGLLPPVPTSAESIDVVSQAPRLARELIRAIRAGPIEAFNTSQAFMKEWTDGLGFHLRIRRTREPPAIRSDSDQLMPPSLHQQGFRVLNVSGYDSDMAAICLAVWGKASPMQCKRLQLQVATMLILSRPESEQNAPTALSSNDTQLIHAYALRLLESGDILSTALFHPLSRLLRRNIVVHAPAVSAALTIDCGLTDLAEDLHLVWNSTAELGHLRIIPLINIQTWPLNMRPWRQKRKASNADILSLTVGSARQTIQFHGGLPTAQSMNALNPLFGLTAPLDQPHEAVSHPPKQRHRQRRMDLEDELARDEPPSTLTSGAVYVREGNTLVPAMRNSKAQPMTLDEVRVTLSTQQPAAPGLPEPPKALDRPPSPSTEGIPPLPFTDTSAQGIIEHVDKRWTLITPDEQAGILHRQMQKNKSGGGKPGRPRNADRWGGTSPTAGASSALGSVPGLPPPPVLPAGATLPAGAVQPQSVRRGMSQRG